VTMILLTGENKAIRNLLRTWYSEKIQNTIT